MAGGPTEFSKKDIILLREEYGVEKRIPIDYKRLLAGDAAQENLYLKPGDTLSLRHRVIFHKGDADAKQIDAAFDAYSKE